MNIFNLGTGHIAEHSSLAGEYISLQIKSAIRKYFLRLT